MMNYLFYLLYGAPFLVVLVDIAATQNPSKKQRTIAYTTAIIGLLSFAYFHNTLFVWIVLFPATFSIFYAARWLGGVARFIVAFPSFSFLCISLSTNLPIKNAFYLRLSELLYMPANVATIVIPPLLLWYLWKQLPAAYGSLRSVPHGTKLRFLICIVVVSLLLNIVLFGQMTSYRSQVNAQVNSARQKLFFEAMQASYILRFRGQETFEDWHPRVVEHMEQYRTAAQRVSELVLPEAAPHNSSFYFIAETIPDGVLGALWQPETLTDADAAKLAAVLKAVNDGIEAHYKPNALSKAQYTKIADHILTVIQEQEALNLFNVLYGRK